MLGWNPGTEQELFTMDQLIADFSLERVGRHGSKFDPEKARWFNHQYIQMKTDEELAEMLLLQIMDHHLSADSEQVEKVCGLIKDRVVLLPDLWKNAAFFFIAPESYDEQVFNKIWKPETAEIIRSFAEEISALSEWSGETLHDFIEGFIARKQIKTGQLMTPVRLLVVGSSQGPGMIDILALIGKNESVARILHGTERLKIKINKA
jgi:glutamyl-tRNA synthetase